MYISLGIGPQSIHPLNIIFIPPSLKFEKETMSQPTSPSNPMDASPSPPAAKTVHPLLCEIHPFEPEYSKLEAYIPGKEAAAELMVAHMMRFAPPQVLGPLERLHLKLIPILQTTPISKQARDLLPLFYNSGKEIKALLDKYEEDPQQEYADKIENMVGTLPIDTDLGPPSCLKILSEKLKNDPGNKKRAYCLGGSAGSHYFEGDPETLMCPMCAHEDIWLD